jgi:S-adenosyl-L-methionine hydrolase (adenosine-forming)
MRIVTLITDFGLKDGNVGVMKGVILKISPRVQIVDLTHLIGAQDVIEAGLILARALPYFTSGTIHVVVVDPGVGTSRRPFVAQIGTQFVIGPDNGFITLALERAEAQGEEVKFVHLNRPSYWLPDVSHVFHGRDIFAPAAAHLAGGLALVQLGTPFEDPVRLHLPHPERTASGWHGEVIHIDHFGNISTNIRQEHLGYPAKMKMRLCGVEIEGMVSTFGERPAGELVALYGSTGNLLACVVNGSAAGQLGAKVGDAVEVTLDQ